MNDFEISLKFSQGEVEEFNLEGDIDYRSNSISIYTKETLSNYDNGAKPFRLDSSLLDDGATYESSYDGYMSQNDFDNTKAFDFTIKGTKIEYILIKFDALTNTYAQTISVIPSINGIDEATQTFSNDDIIFEQKVGYYEEEYTFKVSLSNWVTDLPEGDAIKITAVDATLSYVFSKNKITNLEINNQIIDDNDKPDYGLIGNFGSVSLKDTQETISTLSEGDTRILGEKEKVEIQYANGTNSGSFFPYSYDNPDNYEYTIELESNMLKYNDIIIEKKHYGFDISLLTVFNDVVEKAKANNSGAYDIKFSTKEDYTNFLWETSDYTIYNCNLKEDTFFNQLTKICQCVGYYIYENKTGQLTFIKGDV